ncbi:MAG: hypothetical protein R3F55_11180 [Alphaproteobacteria bacterium]
MARVVRRLSTPWCAWPRHGLREAIRNSGHGALQTAAVPQGGAAMCGLSEFQKWAKKKGYAVCFINQAKTPILMVKHLPFASNQLVELNKGLWGNSTNGFCTGAAIHWICYRYHGAEFYHHPETLWVDIPFHEMTKCQNYLESNDSNMKYIDRVEHVLSWYGLKINRGLYIIIEKPAVDKIIDHTLKYPGYCFLLVMHGDGPGHALAIHSMGKAGWRLFDVNEGVFQCVVNVGSEHENVHKLFKEHMTECEYSIRYSQYYLIGIEKPPYVSGAFDSFKFIIQLETNLAMHKK